MKVRVYINLDNTVKTVETRVDLVYEKETSLYPSLTDIVIDSLELPPSQDSDGISLMYNWFFDGNAIVVDPNLSNPEQMVFDKTKSDKAELSTLLATALPTNLNLKRMIEIMKQLQGL